LVVGIVVIDLSLPGINSLKEKRKIIKSLTARLRNKFNVSIAEVEFNDSLRSAQLGAAVVSNDNKYVDQVIARLVSLVNNESELIMTDYRVEIL
jgi:uncharacterized protein YlxP (DUF503 family)